MNLETTNSNENEISKGEEQKKKAMIICVLCRSEITIYIGRLINWHRRQCSVLNKEISDCSSYESTLVQYSRNKSINCSPYRWMHLILCTQSFNVFPARLHNTHTVNGNQTNEVTRQPGSIMLVIKREMWLL